MHKIGKKILAVMLTSIMVFSMAACGSSDKTDNKTTEKDNTESIAKAGNDTTKDADNTAANNEVDTSEAVTITMLTLGNKPTNGRMEAVLEKVNAILSEKINATLELVYIEWADWQTQYNLALASGDSSYDLIATATDWLDAWPNTKKGAFLPISKEMLQTYAPQTYAAVEANTWDDCTYNGDIYFIPEDNYTQYTNHGIFYRGDWADAAGVGDINSFEQLGNYLQYIKDNKEGVIPWDVSGTIANGNALAGGYVQSTTDAIVIEGAVIGLSTIYYGTSTDDPYTIYSPYMDGDTFEDFAVMMKDWADAGYWREDVLNYDGETRELFYAGSSGADQHHSQTFYGGVKPNMDTKQEGSDAKMFSFSLPSENLVKTSVTHGAMAISNFSSNPERALMVYDLIRNNEEIYRLINYGIEDVDYVLIDKDTFDRPEGWDQSLDSLDIDFWWGRNDEYELVNNQDWDGKADMIAEYDTYAIDYPYGKLVVETSKMETQIAAMSDVCASWIPRIAFGKVDDPVAAVASFKKEMIAAGYNEVLEYFQSQMDEVYQ